MRDNVIKNYIADGASDLCLIKGRNILINIGPIYSQHLLLPPVVSENGSKAYKPLSLWSLNENDTMTLILLNTVLSWPPAHTQAPVHTETHTNMSNIIPLKCFF